MFKPGDVVIFTEDNFNTDFVKKSKESGEWEKWYGDLIGNILVYICQINDADGTHSGHCVLANLKTGKIEVMRHDSDFRLVTDDEF